MISCVEYNSASQHLLDVFFAKAFLANGFLYDPEYTHRDLRNISTVYFNSGGGFWYLTDGNVVIGTAGLRILDIGKAIGELKCMYVLPEYQGTGFGQMLIDKIIAEARKTRLNRIRLDVKISAEKAIACYRKNGFYQIPRYNDNTNDVIFMERNWHDQDT